MKDRSLWRVQVLWFVIAKNSTTKGDSASAAIADGENYAVAKAVVIANGIGVFGAIVLLSFSSFFLDNHPCLEEGLLFIGVPCDRFQKVIPARRGIAYAEIPSDFAAHASSFQIFDGRFALLMTPQLLAIEFTRLFQDFE